MTFKEIYDLLPPYGQVLLTLLTIAIGGYAMWRGLHDRKSQSVDPNIPVWLMMGPVHDVMQSVHGMAEDGRTQLAVLQDIAKTLTTLDRGQEYTHSLLESILRNQEMRGGEFIAPHVSRRKTRDDKG